MRDRWEDNTPFVQAHILAFDQLRSHDENEFQAAVAKAMIPKSPALSSSGGKRGRKR